MFGIGTSEIIVVLLIALLVFGPKKLPEIAHQAGKLIGDFKRVTNDAVNTFKDQLNVIDGEQLPPEYKPKQDSLQPRDKIADNQPNEQQNNSGGNA